MVHQKMAGEIVDKCCDDGIPITSDAEVICVRLLITTILLRHLIQVMAINQLDRTVYHWLRSFINRRSLGYFFWEIS